ncbi:helix-turn-helix transcriptional regulator [Anaerorhabdus furcosa]|uniref:Predicted transcriptional regulator YheO, contains PAS and DNA-binding HTH domains n=1 Tax=Anaerorhabdus furcosa TaxID=118967 RepID=A0A1T4L928_9FIRM|nr:PAS domain-containing protein [Anaerorhabdus furcosa]SJZ51007.1 Predicted transcriptional regulator YheO, contains PAS and DNA-binding HTH domains [Anaerorhabdus furcosa]
MAKQAVELTIIDREILNSYSNMINGLACYLGCGYEIVLHSLENYEHSVINIINGEHTGRSVGAPITDLALDMLDKIAVCEEDYITYFSTNKKGEPLKSTTIAIRGEQNRIIGLVCMNLYLNTPMIDIIDTLIPQGQLVRQQTSKENFVDNSNELIESTLESIKEKVYADSTIAVSNKNKVIVYTLDDYGIFNIKDAVIKVAELLDISKNTVYMHIRNKKESN